MIRVRQNKMDDTIFKGFSKWNILALIISQRNKGSTAVAWSS